MAPTPRARRGARTSRTRRLATGSAIAALFAGTGVLTFAAVTGSDLALVLSGVVLVCAGGIAGVLASPSVSVVDARDDRAAGFL